MNFRRFKQVCQYGWKDSATISREEGVHKTRFGVFLDIMGCFFKYNVWSNQYKKEKLYSLSGTERDQICLKYQEQNTKRDKWVKEFFDNYKFLNKWSSFKYELSAELQAKRREAYKKRYGLGDNCFIGYDVIFHRHHYVNAIIQTGKDCLIAEQVNIDYTGGLVLGNSVSVSEGVKILTHNHIVDLLERGKVKDDGKGCICTPLKIQDRVWIGSKAIIMPGVSEIGRGAMISANAYVYKKVPPYAIVMGNPGKIIGFRMTPNEIVEFEKNQFPEEQRIPIDVLENNYNKYFKSRINVIKEFVK